MLRALSLLFALWSAALPSFADAAGDELARRIAERPANEGRVGDMHFTLTNASGDTRARQALMIHAERQGTIQIAIFFVAPAAIENTAFLSHDRRVGEDDTWLFLPATERVRRLPSADKGDYFMGTDITYGDIKDDFKFPLEYWSFTSGGTRLHAGSPYNVLRGAARSSVIARETGYGAFEALVDTASNFPVWIEYTDPDGTPLKRAIVQEQAKIGGAWTALRFSVENLQTGHKTQVRFENMRHAPGLLPTIFEPDALSAGPPKLK
jgi:hypothetical protein